MSEQSDKQTPDIMQLWRRWLTESERQFNAFASEAMNTEAFARTVGGYVEMYAAFQRMLAEGMQRYLSFINVPSRSDVIGLGETMRSIEGRLARIEETLQMAAEAVDAGERGPARVSEPARTRVPPGVPTAEEARAEAPVIPEQTRAETPALSKETYEEAQPLPEDTRQETQPLPEETRQEAQPLPEETRVAVPTTPQAETLRAMEGQLARIEETLQIAAEVVDAGEGGPARVSEPARTRVPPGVPTAEEVRAEAAASPEQARAEAPALSKETYREAQPFPEETRVAVPTTPEAETLRVIEGRLARIEETLQIAAAVVSGDERSPSLASEPLPTRRPAGVLASEEDGAEASVIPEELRR